MRKEQELKEVERLKEFLENWWKSDFDISIKPPNENSTKLLIFELGYDSYWTYNPNEWHFSGYRYIPEAAEIEDSKYKKFYERLEKTGATDIKWTLKNAKKLIELVYSSKMTKYKDIKRLVEQIKNEIEYKKQNALKM